MDINTDTIDDAKGSSNNNSNKTQHSTNLSTTIIKKIDKHTQHTTLAQEI